MNQLPEFDGSVDMLKAVRSAAPKIVAKTIGVSLTGQAKRISEFIAKNGGGARFKTSEVTHQNWLRFIREETEDPYIIGTIHAAWEWMRAYYPDILAGVYFKDAAVPMRPVQNARQATTRAKAGWVLRELLSVTHRTDGGPSMNKAGTAWGKSNVIYRYPYSEGQFAVCVVSTKQVGGILNCEVTVPYLNEEGIARFRNYNGEYIDHLEGPLIVASLAGSKPWIYLRAGMAYNIIRPDSPGVLLFMTESYQVVSTKAELIWGEEIVPAGIYAYRSLLKRKGVGPVMEKHFSP